MGKKTLKKAKKKVLRNIDMFLISVAVILIWRGVWNLVDQYFVPDLWVLSNILSICLGIFILLIHNFDLREL